MRLWPLLAVLLVAATYTVVPAQDVTRAQAWTQDQTVVLELINSTLTSSKELLFVAMDADSDGTFDRGGVPTEGRIVLYPVGVLRGTVNGEAVVRPSCQHVGLKQVRVDSSFLLPLPAGDCAITISNAGQQETIRVEVVANDVVDVDVVLADWTNRVLFGLLILALFAAAIWGTKRYAARGQQRELPAVVQKLLTKQERRVARYVLRRGPVIAGVVRKDLEIPKTSFHRIIKKLREKELINEEEYGNTTQLSWNETFQANTK